jgi:transposase-like protein
MSRITKEEKERIAKVYLLTGSLRETSKQTGFNFRTVKKYVQGLEKELEARPMAVVAESARTAALDDLDPAVEKLKEVLDRPLNQVLAIKAAEAMSKLVLVKAKITGEVAPSRVESVSAQIDLTKYFRELMGYDNEV